MGNYQVNVVGLGYIGLPTALALAAHGVKVAGTDYNPAIIEKLRSDKLTFSEEGLEKLFQDAKSGGIYFSKSYEKADFYIISVPTPYDKKTKKVDAGYIVKAVEQVLTVCERGAVIVIESTVSPGTIDCYIRPVLKTYGFQDGLDIHLAHAPERIIPGSMIRELTKNPRTIGADSLEIGERVKNLYASFCQGEITLTDIRSAEMSKVVENAYRDINIAYANALARICHAANLNVYEIIKIANQHPRVNILSPGPGVGGHCISVDPWFLVGDYPEEADLIRKARETNDAMPEFVLNRVYDLMREENLKDVSRVGFYGLTYKEDVDDTRESPTLQLIEHMKNHLAPAPKVFDPMCTRDITENQYHDFSEFLRDIDLLVIMVNHRHLRENWNLVCEKIIFDVRNCGLDSSGQRRYVRL